MRPQRLDGGAEHPAIERRKQAVLRARLEKLVRRHELAGRVAEANEQLVPGDRAARPQADDRLRVELELIRRERVAQIGRGDGLACRRGRQRREVVDDRDARAAVGFRALARELGRREQVL